LLSLTHLARMLSVTLRPLLLCNNTSRCRGFRWQIKLEGYKPSPINPKGIRYRSTYNPSNFVALRNRTAHSWWKPPVLPLH